MSQSKCNKSNDMWGLVRTSSALIQKCLNTLRFRSKLFHAMRIVYNFSRGDCSYQAKMHVQCTERQNEAGIVTFLTKAY